VSKMYRVEVLITEEEMILLTEGIMPAGRHVSISLAVLQALWKYGTHLQINMPLHCFARGRGGVLQAPAVLPEAAPRLPEDPAHPLDPSAAPPGTGQPSRGRRPRPRVGSG
jgi:hypothetical protein